jgi:osmotically-inducible protein OsmY
VLTGAVRRRSEADTLPQVVRRIPGVVAVRSEISWTEDE